MSMLRHVGLIGVAIALTAALGACGDSQPDGPSAAHVEAVGSDIPEAPSPSPSAAPSPTPKPTHKPKPTAPPTLDIPQPPGCAGFIGKNLSKSAVSSLLTKSQKVQYWKTLPQTQVDPGMWPVPTIKAPLSLLRAIAYMESGWRTACKANDGIGFGLFQISLGTQQQMNDRFHTTFDRQTASGNAAIAVEYLEWLAVKIGYPAFNKQFDVTKSTGLLEAVIASFNYGPDAVLVGDGTTIPNPDYVSAVREMMGSDCPCQHW